MKITEGRTPQISGKRCMTINVVHRPLTFESNPEHEHYSGTYPKTIPQVKHDYKSDTQAPCWVPLDCIDEGKEY